jgi:hypothetical protein
MTLPAAHQFLGIQLQALNIVARKTFKSTTISGIQAKSPCG